MTNSLRVAVVNEIRNAVIALGYVADAWVLFEGRRYHFWFEMDANKIMIVADLMMCGEPSDYVFIHDCRTKDLQNMRDALCAKLGRKVLREKKH